MHALEKQKSPMRYNHLYKMENSWKGRSKTGHGGRKNGTGTRSVPKHQPLSTHKHPQRHGPTGTNPPAPSSHMHSGSDYWALAVALAAAQRAAVAVRAAMRSALPGQVEQKRDKWSPLQ